MTNDSMKPRGVIPMTDHLNVNRQIDFVRQLDNMGYDSFWIPELFGREIMANASQLVAKTERIRIATGIANVYIRDAHATVQARHTIAEFANGRFILGLGVSNVGLNTARGHQWQAPAQKLNAYLDMMEKAEPDMPTVETLGPMVIAAHGPVLQRIAATRSDGVMTYLMSAEHTATSRKRIGPDVELNVVVPVLGETDQTKARNVCRSALSYYTTLDYYRREWREHGFDDSDFADNGSDRLLDHLVAHGTPEALEARIHAHELAGASRIILLPLDAHDGDATASSSLSAMAPIS